MWRCERRRDLEKFRIVVNYNNIYLEIKIMYYVESRNLSIHKYKEISIKRFRKKFRIII